MQYLRLFISWLGGLRIVRLLGFVTAPIWWVPYLWSCILRDKISGEKAQYEGTASEFMHSLTPVLIQTGIWLAGWGYVLLRRFGG
jgi:hypothetical protein